MMDLLSLFPAWLLFHGPALIVVLPLLCGAITAILPNRQSAWTLCLIVTLICGVTAFGLMLQSIGSESVTYKLGGWDPPHGIAYVIDALNAPLLLLISVMAILCTIYALPAVVAEVQPKKRAPIYAAFLICIAGLLGMVATGDAFNVFVFLEVSSISTYALVAMGSSRDHRAVSAAFNYLIMGSIGATFFVIGLGFLYMETGTLNMADMGRILRDLDGGSRVAEVAFGFIVVGLGLKLAMFPLHTWLAGAYAYSPSFVTVFLASTATKAALYLMFRFVFIVFDIEFAYVAVIIKYLITGFGIIGMVYCSLQAIFQTDARRTLAFSSVAQVGYMLLGIGLGTAAGLAASYLHLLNHALIKGGLFIALGAFWYRFGITRISDFKGLAKTMPLTMGAFSVLGLSLIGVPFTAGFVSKLNLTIAAADKGWWWAIGVIVATSILAIFYIGQILRLAYFEDPPDVKGQIAGKNEAPLMMLIPLWGLALASIVIGVNASMPVMAAEAAADLMMPVFGGVGS